MSVLEYLKKQEWSMGCGQCPECGGVPESWYGYLGHTEVSLIGHKPDCSLAKSITEVGGSPLMRGEYKNETEYETFWGKNDILCVRKKTDELTRS